MPPPHFCEQPLSFWGSLGNWLRPRIIDYLFSVTRPRPKKTCAFSFFLDETAHFLFFRTSLYNIFLSRHIHKKPCFADEDGNDAIPKSDTCHPFWKMWRSRTMVEIFRQPHKLRRMLAWLYFARNARSLDFFILSTNSKISNLLLPRELCLSWSICVGHRCPSTTTPVTTGTRGC